MDQRTNFKLKGGLNFLCIAGGIAIITSTFIKLDKWATKEQERKQLKEAVEAVKTIDELVKKLDKIKVDKTDSEEEETK